MPPHVILFNPEIPQNTGNIIRLCANTGAELHLIKPLGFNWEDKRLRRAGLDYHEYARVKLHTNLNEYLASHPKQKLVAFSTKGKKNYTSFQYDNNHSLIFGPETKGLPEALLARLGPEYVLRLPMQENSRSLNLSNAVAVATYEAWRQQSFAIAKTSG